MSRLAAMPRIAGGASRKVWRAKSRQGSRLRFGFSARLCEPGALRCSASWPGAKLTTLTSFAAFRQSAPSQRTKRAARAAKRLALLGVEQALCRLPCRAFARGDRVFGKEAHHECREDGAGGRSGACAAPSTGVQRGESGAQRQTGEKSLWAGASSAGAGGIAAAPRNEERRAPTPTASALQRSRCAHPPRPCAHATKQSVATTATGRLQHLTKQPRTLASHASRRFAPSSRISGSMGADQARTAQRTPPVRHAHPAAVR